MHSSKDLGDWFTLRSDGNRQFIPEETMSNERSDKGTERELTQIASKVDAVREQIFGFIDDETMPKHEVKANIRSVLSDLKQEITQYDQRDRLEKDVPSSNR